MLSSKVRQLLKNSSLRRYLIIGVSVFGIELAAITIFESFGISPVLAVGLAFWLGLATSFVLQKFVAFDDKRTHHKVLLPQVAAFGLLVLWNFGFTILLAHIFRDILPAVLIRTIALGITTVWNYYLYRTRIFVAGGTGI